MEVCSSSSSHEGNPKKRKRERERETFCSYYDWHEDVQKSQNLELPPPLVTIFTNYYKVLNIQKTVKPIIHPHAVNILIYLLMGILMLDGKKNIITL